MVRFTWEARLAVVLVALSVSIYAVKITFLNNPSDTANYIFNALGFLPINVLLVTIVLNKLLAIRAKRERMEKMNMVIGTFFTEVGNRLIREIASGDPEIGRIRASLLVGTGWDAGAFAGVKKKIASHDCAADASAEELVRLHDLLSSQRDFLLRLLENPVLLEHESFTELLRAVFHLTEELRQRHDLMNLPATDHAHLQGDIRRVYRILVLQWLDYMEYLQTSYPYLCSLEMRTNPFDPAASPVVLE
jgi:hypothetical protein